MDVTVHYTAHLTPDQFRRLAELARELGLECPDAGPHDAVRRLLMRAGLTGAELTLEIDHLPISRN